MTYDPNNPNAYNWQSGDPMPSFMAPPPPPSPAQPQTPQYVPAVTNRSEVTGVASQNHQQMIDAGYIHTGDGTYIHSSQVQDLYAAYQDQADKLYPSNPYFGNDKFVQNHPKLASVISGGLLGLAASNPGPGPQSAGQNIAAAARGALAPGQYAHETALERNQFVNTNVRATQAQQAALTEEELKLSQIAKNNEGTPVGEPREDGKGGTFQILNTPRGLISVPYPVQRPDSPNIIAPSPSAQSSTQGTAVAGSIAAPPSNGSSASAGYAPYGTPIGQKPSEEDKALTDYIQTSGLPNTAQGREQARTDLFYRQHPSDAPIGSDGAASKNAIITSQLKKAGIDPSLYSVAATDSVTAANAKQSSAEKALSDQRAQQSNERAARIAALDIASKQQNMEAKADENVVAYDPNYVNADGSKGGNVVMPRGQAEANSLSHYKVDAALVNANVAGFNDVQTKINQLAAVTNNPNTMKNVQADIAAAMLKHDKGITLGVFGVSVDTSMINARLYQEDVGNANQATRDYVTATIAAHEAMTQLPRLQTFGKSNRMSQQQMEASQAMLPAPGDDASLAAQKMQSLQTTIDPLRKQMPHMQGAELIPTWAEQNKNRSSTSRENVNPSDVVRTGNLNGKKVYQLKDGSTVDGQGNRVQ